MSVLWTIDDFLAGTHGRPVGDMPEEITGISIDSRTIEKGHAFFAIKGDNFDGHKFVRAAAVADAGVAIISESKLASLGAVALPLIVVKDVLESLVLLGHAARIRSHAKIVAITGSVGKTTTKEMMRVALSASGTVHASVASFNNHWGVPITLARMPADVDYAIFEIGMNHANEITPLVNMVRPHVALITNVAAAHLGSFKNVSEIAKAKAEIFSGLSVSGTAIINHDNPHLRLLKMRAKKAGIKNILTFGDHKKANFRLKSVKRTAERTDVEAVIAGKKIDFTLYVGGRHMISNALAVLGVSSVLGADVQKSATALAGVAAEQGRGQRHVIKLSDGTLTIIDDAFNANTASMEAGLAMLGECEPAKNGQRIAVLGDMLELGRFSKELHEKLVEPIVVNDIDQVFMVGEEMLALKEVLPKGLFGGHFDSVGELQSKLLKTLHGGDVVIFKASKGLKFVPLVEKIVEAFKKKTT